MTDGRRRIEPRGLILRLPRALRSQTLNALAPLLVNKLIEPGNIVIDVKTGISGGGDSKFGYAESNENSQPYGLLKHVHMPEIAKTIERLSGGSAAGLVFTPHLVPMTRGVLATIYCGGSATTGQCLDAARRLYAGRAFVRVTDKPPQTKWATGSNLAFVSYAANPERNLVIAMGVVDNLGKGAAGRAVRNANLICGLPETAGLDGAPVWP
ncbi:Asd/ArgC dimerization domain-containing protein [Bradyrhizobium sp. SZCCHNR2017]|uniref:Asd/ArgC dimerization domain-containing protein n=1 Tax=unclassified Bradyrhizobium TaxID=2631580 RepID=UPI0039675065